MSSYPDAYLDSESVRRLIRRFDAWLSRRYGIFVFSQQPDCVLRLQRTVAHRHLSLPDCQIERGDPVLLIHLWNERLSALLPPEVGLGRAKALQRLLLGSLAQAACYLSEHVELANARAVGGVTVLLGSEDRSGGVQLVERLGFSVFPYRSPLGRFGEFWENFYSWMLIWTYDPVSLPDHRLWRLRRREFWISAQQFRLRFGTG